MGSSSPANDPPAPSGSAPRRETLTTIAEQVAALDTLIELAQVSIRVFDIDLSDMGWNQSARADRIVAFLHTRRRATVDIVLHDTAWAEKSCPRLSNLLKHYSHAIVISRCSEEGRKAMDPMVVVDGRHFLHRFHHAQPRAAFGIEQPAEAGPLVERFSAIRAHAEPGITATVLGL